MQFIAQIMSIAFTPILLLIIFFYQKNKNKLLVDMLRENKALSDHHASVAKTAIEYSKAFDTDKFESIIKRELELKYKEVIKEKDDNVTKHKHDVDRAIQGMTELIVKPLVHELIPHLALLDNQDRIDFFATLPKHFSDVMLKRLTDFDKFIETERHKALDKIQ